MTLLAERPVEVAGDGDRSGGARPGGAAAGRPWPSRRSRLGAAVVDPPSGRTAVAYLWALGDSGWANSFYAAAVQAGTKSWKAFFFGSSDASNFITVDKPPASLWVMEISARLFGLNSWSLLVPQALEGVATVALLYATVRRWFRPGAALLAGAVAASTPVAVLMFRYDNPDALLVLLLTLAAYATVRALEEAKTMWLVLAASAVGLGFTTKMLQAFLVVPAIGAVYLLAAPTPLGRRIKQLLLAGVALVVSAGWWVAAVQLTPAADRPYIGGSQNNSLLNLIFGYNGLGRLSGNESGSVGGGATGGSRWGPTGLFASLPDRHGWADLVAHPRRPDHAGGRPRPHLAGAADRPDPGRRRAVGRVAARDRVWSSATPRESSIPITTWPWRRPWEPWWASER